MKALLLSAIAMVSQTLAQDTQPVPAPPTAAQLKASLASELHRAIEPFWKPPAGPDAELLRTVIGANLAEDGSLIGAPLMLRQSGVTDANRNQAALHREAAVRAVRRAAPFTTLPRQYYDSWKKISMNFDSMNLDKGMSR